MDQSKYPEKLIPKIIYTILITGIYLYTVMVKIHVNGFVEDHCEALLKYTKMVKSVIFIILIKYKC